MRAIAAASLFIAATSVMARAQSTPPSPGEGPLQNDVFLPTSQAAEKSLAAGDAAWQRSRTANNDASALVEAFEGWHAAIAMTKAGESVSAMLPSAADARGPVWPDPDHTARRRTEAVECAVLRRLRAIPAADRSAFVARFDPVARVELAHAGADLARCAQVERAHPLTSAASEAALRLADSSLEAGRNDVAAGWLARARMHAEASADAGSARRLHDAIERRSALLPPVGAAHDALRDTRALHLVAALPLPPPASEERSTVDELPRTGIALAPSGAFVVQTAERIHGFDGAGERTTIDPADLASAYSWVWTPALGRASAGVPIRPVTDGARVWTTIGRSQSDRGNVLACIAIGEGKSRASIAWGYWSGGFHQVSGREEPLATALGPGIWSFEPGPLLVGADLFVSARQWITDSEAGGTIDEGHTRAWCLCLDSFTGTVRWSRLLATGADARFDPALTARMRSPRGMPGPAQPLVRIGTSVFVATEVGAGVCLDVCDGRPLWSLRNQREPGPAHARMHDPCVLDADLVLWSPGDSRFSYALHLDAPHSGTESAILAAQPWASIDIEQWAGGSLRALVGVARRGARSAPIAIDPIGGEAVESWPFASEERPGDARASPTRALIATDRALYFLDRSRELALLDREALSASGGPPMLAVRGNRIFVAAPRGIWIFEAR